jgi:hypothetical protein
MNILGVGQAGVAIAEQFENFPQYNVYFIDVENKKNHKNFFKIKEQESHEDYEENYRSPALKKIKGDVTIVLCGAGKISGIILRLIKQLGNRKISVLYVKPDLSTCTEKQTLRHRLVFGVLQQYVRSNLISNIFLVSNSLVEAALDEISIASYWQDLNNIISSTYHMINVFENTEPILSNLTDPGKTSKIVSLGVMGFETFNEKIFYELEKPRLKKYFFGVTEKTLNEEKALLHKIRNYVKEKSEQEEKCDSCFAIYSTQYEQNYVYCCSYASKIQEENI